MSEVFTIEFMKEDGEWVPMRHSSEGDHGYMLRGGAASYKSRKDAQRVSNLITWGRSRHRIVRYVRESKEGKR